MILVFGKTGQVAIELQKSCEASGIAARFLGRDEADLTDPAACSARIAQIRPELVINAAAYTAVDKAEADADTAMAVNGDAPTAMARACAALDIPFVHISTDYVFDGEGTTPFQPRDITGPLGIYGQTKLAGEQGILESGAQAVILRTSWVFSSHGANFVKTMLRLSETRDALTVVGDQVGGPTAASEIAAACLNIGRDLASQRGATGVYHFSGAPDVSWADFAREIFVQAGRTVSVTDIPTSAYPTPAKRPANSRMDCSDLERDYEIARPDWRTDLSNVLTELGAK
jgi:dTDP-4-dehydrorhamnose reductase